LRTTYEYLAAWLRAKVGGDDRGAAVIEYVLLAAMVAVMGFVALVMIGRSGSSASQTAGTPAGS
jgi:hypothetical protein